MACPTCDHTMHGLGERWFWCPRCGTTEAARGTLNGADHEHTVIVPSATLQTRAWLKSKHVTDVTARGILRELVLSPKEREEVAP